MHPRPRCLLATLKEGFAVLDLAAARRMPRPTLSSIGMPKIALHLVARINMMSII